MFHLTEEKLTELKKKAEEEYKKLLKEKNSNPEGLAVNRVLAPFNYRISTTEWSEAQIKLYRHLRGLESGIQKSPDPEPPKAA